MRPALTQHNGDPGGSSRPGRPVSASEEPDDSRSSSSTGSPAAADHEESDFFLNNNDSQSSLGVNIFQDVVMNDNCPPMDRLPNEILMCIFAKLAPSTHDLYHVMLVCKRWARNSVDLLWHRPTCNNWRNHEIICQTLGVENPYFRYADFVKRLNLAALGEEVNDGSVQPLSVCTRIERLTLPNCRGLTDLGLMSLVNGSTWLSALDISDDENITERSINAVAESCKRLQGLNITGCENISNESLINLARNCRSIKRLKLNECAQLRDDAVHAFAENCPNMLEIDLHMCNLIGNGPITALLTKGTVLRELRLANCDLVDDYAFLSLPSSRTFEHLRILDLTSCARLTDAAVVKIIDAAPRLGNLVLAKCRNITDTSVKAIAKLGKNLHYVHLGHCGQITDEGVKELIQQCNRIRYIDLGCCTNLTDDSVRRLATLPKLKRIGLVKCSNISDDSVLALADSYRRLRPVRDSSGRVIGGHGDAYYSSSLERVHLSYCVNLTLKSIFKLLNCCTRLTHLSLTGVAAFQRDDFQPFCRAAPPEFTQHQRDVFCVFSGHSVNHFRNYLNTDEQFKELRQNSSFRRMRDHVTQHHQSPSGLDILDDEMNEVDGDDDFEAMDVTLLHPPIVPPGFTNPLDGYPPFIPNVGLAGLSDHFAPGYGNWGILGEMLNNGQASQAPVDSAGGASTAPLHMPEAQLPSGEEAVDGADSNEQPHRSI